jgi:predicted dehydrogenase
VSQHTFGIVGLSWITSEPEQPGTHPVLGHAVPHTHLSALANIPSARVVAGCDISEEARNLFLERWGDTWPDLRVFNDYTEMLNTAKPEVVCVATPDNLHLPVVLAAVEAGAKAIFCEKPMSTHTDDIDTMIEAIEANNVVVNVNHTRRWMPPYVAAREVLRSGQIGELVQINSHLGGERAMLWRNHSHVIDLLNYFADSNPIWVVGELEPGFEDYGTRYHGDGGRDPLLEPGANAYVGFENGVRAFHSGMKRAFPMLSVELVGTDGKMIVTDQGGMLYRQTDSGVAATPIVPRGTVAGNQAAILDLLTALETGTEPQLLPREARKTVAIIEGILESQASGNGRVSLS